MIDEAESAALVATIDDVAPDLVACFLLETELRRAVHRGPALTQEAVSTFLTGISLYELSVSSFQEAGLLAGQPLRSLDSLHLMAAIRIGVDRVVTYDARMADAALSLGLTVSAPA